MSNATLATILNILQDLTNAVAFLLCAAAAYLTLQQPKVKEWLAGAGALVKIAIFVVLAKLLSLAVIPIVSDVFAFPRGLLNRDSGFTSSAQCLSGVLVLVGLVVGSWLLAKGSAAADAKE